MAKKFFVALEEEAVVEVTPEVTSDEVLETKSEVEETNDEMAEVATDVEELQAAIEEGLESGETLVDLGGAVEAKIADGEGLSEDAAKIAEVAIESIRVRLGMPKSVGRIPSMESFKAPRRRLEASRVALEAGVFDTIKKIWAKIVDFCKAVWEKILALVGKLTKSYATLEKHLVAIKSKAEAATGEPAEAELNKGGLAKFFSIGGKADFDTAKKSLEIAGKFEPACKKVMNIIASKANFAEIAEMSPEKADEELQACFKMIAEGFSSSGIVAELPGNTMLVVKTEGGKFDIEFEAGKESAKMIKALTKDEIVSLLDMAIAEAKAGPELKSSAEDADKTLKAIITAAEKIMAVLSKGADPEKGKSVKQASTMAGAATKIVSKLSGKLPVLHFQTVKMAGDYASAALLNFKKEEKKEEKK